MFKNSSCNTLTFSVTYGNIADSIDSFLLSKKIENRSTDTIRFYKWILNAISKWLSENEIYRWEDLTPDVIRKMLAELQDSGHSQGGVHAYYRTIKAYINWYWNEYDVELKNPITKVKCSNRKPEPLPGITISEIDKILSAVSGSEFPERDNAMIYLLVDVGVRKSELMDLKYKNLNCDTGEVVIEHGKGDKRRTVFMGRECRKTVRKYFRLLRNCKPDDTIWYTIEGTPLTASGAKEILRRLQKRAGFDKFHSFHDFRRCSAVESKRNGGSDIEVSRKLGHSSLEVTKRYFALNEEDDQLFGEKSSPMDHRKK